MVINCFFLLLSTVRFLISIIIRLSLKIVLFSLSTVTLFIVDWVIFLCSVIVRWALNIFSSGSWLSDVSFLNSSQLITQFFLQSLSTQYYFLFLIVSLSLKFLSLDCLIRNISNLCNRRLVTKSFSPVIVESVILLISVIVSSSVQTFAWLLSTW